MSLVQENKVYYLRENTTGAEDRGCLFRYRTDNDGFVFFFEVQDEDMISPFTADNEDIWKGDAVEVFLSPDGNLSRYTEIEVSPFGVRFHAQITNEKGKPLQVCKTGPDFSAEVSGTQQGYQVTVRLSYASLAGYDREKMKMNAFRLDRKADGRQLLYALSPTLCDSFHHPEFFL